MINLGYSEYEYFDDPVGAVVKLLVAESQIVDSILIRGKYLHELQMIVPDLEVKSRCNTREFYITMRVAFF